MSGAEGLRVGAQVRLAGIAIGNVRQIRVSSDPNPNRAVEIVMRIPRRYQAQIRADSTADAATAGLLGESFIDISRGNPRLPVVPDHGEIKSREEADIKRIVQNTNDVVSNLRVLSAKLNDIVSEIQTGKGSFGKILYDPSLYNRADDIAATVQRMARSVENGQGTIGKFVTDESVYQRSLATIDRVNQFIDEVEHGQGSAGKFISDPAVYDNLNKVVLKANSVVDKIDSNQGTLGRLINDSQLYDRLNETVDHLNVVTGRMSKGEGTLGLLSTDKTLYNNLSDSSKSLRDFLTEFRQNPKKYLTLHMHIF
jgi:phospholipid/cholesterol/gamma-HCH transport system substrate-binding protein